MDDSIDDLGEVAYAGKLKTQPFKELQLERLIKSGTVIPASKLVETKELGLQRVRDFVAAAADGKRHRRSETTEPGIAPGDFPQPVNL
jgi:hypothetical protein